MTSKGDAARGWLLENLVFLTLRRGDYGIEYYNTAGGGEVDFITTDRMTRKRRLIQVAWEMPDMKTKSREMSALVDARRETGIDDCTIVTWDDEFDVDGIQIVPVWKWCLAENKAG